MNYFITGDTHGRNFERITQSNLSAGHALIILGDSGFNFWKNKTDKKIKRK